MQPRQCATKINKTYHNTHHNTQVKSPSNVLDRRATGVVMDECSQGQRLLPAYTRDCVVTTYPPWVPPVHQRDPDEENPVRSAICNRISQTTTSSSWCVYKLYVQCSVVVSLKWMKWIAWVKMLMNGNGVHDDKLWFDNLYLAPSAFIVCLSR